MRRAGQVPCTSAWRALVLLVLLSLGTSVLADTFNPSSLLFNSTVEGTVNPCAAKLFVLDPHQSSDEQATARLRLTSSPLEGEIVLTVVANNLYVMTHPRPLCQCMI